MAHLGLLLTGIVVVLVVLVSLWGACVIMGLAFRQRSSPDAAKPAEEPPHEGIPAHHIAVITGAVAEMTPGAFRVLNVRTPALIATTWAESTRFQQVHTHRVRWNWAMPGKLTAHASPNTAKTDSSQKDQDPTVIAKIST